MISTANLIDEDYGLKTQAFYYCRGTFFDGSDDTETRPSKFTDDMLEYLEQGDFCFGGQVFLNFLNF
jgi:hypothetical protein